MIRYTKKHNNTTEHYNTIQNKILLYFFITTSQLVLGAGCFVK